LRWILFVINLMPCDATHDRIPPDTLSQNVNRADCTEVPTTRRLGGSEGALPELSCRSTTG